MQRMQTFLEWKPVPDLPRWFVSASLRYEDDELHVVLHSEDGRNLCLSFGRAPAFRSIVEECRLNSDSRYPAVSRGKGPCWIVENSSWLASFSDADRIHYRNLTHYLLESGDQCVDVLAVEQPHAAWMAEP
jgi:hypothetical protein